MARTIRFHLDEHVGNAIAASLRRLGIDVSTTHEAGLRGSSDDKHFEFANRTGRVIFTQDDDFLVLANLGLEHSGVVFCKQNTLSIGEIIDGLELIWELCEPEELRNRVEFL